MSRIKSIPSRVRRWSNGDVIDDVNKLKKSLDESFQAIRNRIDEVDGRMVNAGILPISDTEIVAKIFTGLKIYLDPRDISVVPHLALDTIWEPDITKAWLLVAKKSGVTFDIGANFGYYGLIAAQKYPSTEPNVYLFEANPKLIPYMRKTLDTNWLNRQIVLENLAVSATEGEVELHIPKDYLGSSSLHSVSHTNEYMKDRMHLVADDVITVSSVSIDSYCSKNKIKTVDLIKIDIEGYEEEAYKGMQKTVEKSKNLSLFIEFTKDSYENPIKFYNQLLKDFGHVYIIESNGVISKPKNNSYESIIGINDDWVMPIFSKISNLESFN